VDDFPILPVDIGRGAKPPQEYVPYSAVLRHEKQCLANHGGQSAAVLKRRGGLSWHELLAVLLDVPYKRVRKDLTVDDYRRHCLAIIEKEKAL